MNRVLRDGLVLLVCLCLQSWTGSALNIDIAPRNVNGLVHNVVHLRCKLDNTDADVKEIMLLELTKGGVTIALHRQNSQTTIGAGLTSKFQVEGNISTSVYESYMDVTLTNPEVVDSGFYTCQMFYLDHSNVLKEATTSDNLTVSDNDVKAAIRHLVDLESVQKDRVDLLEKELDQQKNAHEAREAELQDEISLLKTQVGQQEQSLKSLSDKENTVVLFTAVHNRSGVFHDGDVLAFGNVIVNEGGAYDGHRGVFTAPVSGYYLLGVSINELRNKFSTLDLRTKNGNVLTRLATGEPQWQDFSETACVAKLNAGEQVMPVLEWVYNGFALWNHDASGMDNKFYGYLLKAL